MNTSRWAVAYLLLVVGGGVILVADAMFGFTVSTGNYEIPFGLSGLAFLGGGIASLIEAANRRRVRAIGWIGLFVGFALMFVIYYAGIGLLVLTGIGLFVVAFNCDSRPSEGPA